MKLNSDPHALNVSHWLMKAGFAILMLATAIMIYADLTQESSMTSKIFGHSVLVVAYVLNGFLYFIIRKREKQQSE